MMESSLAALRIGNQGTPHPLCFSNEYENTGLISARVKKNAKKVKWKKENKGVILRRRDS
jgi:hypothetical protein